MSNTVCIDIETRDGSLNPRQLRATGKLPATVYGNGMESASIQLDRHNFVQLYKNNKDAVYELKGTDNSYKAVVQNLQVNYATLQELNIEFKTV